MPGQLHKDSKNVCLPLVGELNKKGIKYNINTWTSARGLQVLMHLHAGNFSFKTCYVGLSQDTKF